MFVHGCNEVGLFYLANKDHVILKGFGWGKQAHWKAVLNMDTHSYCGENVHDDCRTILEEVSHSIV